jgi:hypothetical protein
MIFSQKTVHVIESPDTAKAKPRRLPDWCLVTWFVTSGLVCDWYCAFEWFTGRYTHFSGPVLGVMGLIVVFCASIAFLAIRLFGGKWRAAVLVFSIASYTLSGDILIWWDIHR